MDRMIEKYEQFGDEWKKEMMKSPKYVIVEIASEIGKEKIRFAEMAYEAGKKEVEQDWHLCEFHISTCDCTPLTYNNFQEWLSQQEGGKG